MVGSVGEEPVRVAAGRDCKRVRAIGAVTSCLCCVSR